MIIVLCLRSEYLRIRVFGSYLRRLCVEFAQISSYRLAPIEVNWAELTDFWDCYYGQVKKNWPIADWNVSSNDPRNDCGRISAPVPFSF